MAETLHELKKLLLALQSDVDKAFKGNKSAAQRVRAGTISFTKLAKIYRKESLAAEKSSVCPRRVPKKEL